MRLETWKGTWLPTMGQRLTFVQNVRSHLDEQTIWGKFDNPQWSESSQMYRMWRFIWSRCASERTNAYPQWGERTQMYRMWKFIWTAWKPEKAHVHPRWEEAIQVHTIWLCIFTSRQLKISHQNVFFTKIKEMQMVQLFFNPTIATYPTSAHPHWREDTSI